MDKIVVGLVLFMLTWLVIVWQTAKADNLHKEVDKLDIRVNDLEHHYSERDIYETGFDVGTLKEQERIINLIENGKWENAEMLVKQIRGEEWK